MNEKSQDTHTPIAEQSLTHTETHRPEGLQNQHINTRTVHHGAQHRNAHGTPWRQQINTRMGRHGGNKSTRASNDMEATNQYAQRAP